MYPLIEATESAEIPPMPQGADPMEWLYWGLAVGGAVLLVLIARWLGVRFTKKPSKFPALLLGLLMLGALCLSACTTPAAKEGLALVQKLRVTNEDNYSFGDREIPVAVPESAKATERAAIDQLEDLLKAMAGE